MARIGLGICLTGSSTSLIVVGSARTSSNPARRSPVRSAASGRSRSTFCGITSPDSEISRSWSSVTGLIRNAKSACPVRTCSSSFRRIPKVTDVLRVRDALMAQSKQLFQHNPVQLHYVQLRLPLRYFRMQPLQLRSLPPGRARLEQRLYPRHAPPGTLPPAFGQESPQIRRRHRLDLEKSLCLRAKVFVLCPDTEHHPVRRQNRDSLARSC